MIQTAMSMSNVTTLITAAHQGAPGAEAELFNRLYSDLKRLAHAQLSNGRRPGDTLDTTVLVHEAYLRLSGGAHLDAQSRARFFNLAARVIRNVAGHLARRRAAALRAA